MAPLTRTATLLLALLILAALPVPLVASQFAGVKVTGEGGEAKDSFRPGDVVEISGVAPLPGALVGIQVTGPEGRIILLTAVAAEEDRTFFKSFKLPADTPAGEYAVDLTQRRSDFTFRLVFRVEGAAAAAPLEPSSILLAGVPSPLVVELGESLTVSGLVVPPRAVEVTVEVDGERQTVRSGPDGSFAFTYTPKKAGRWNVMLSIPADGRYRAAQASVALEVREPPEGWALVDAAPTTLTVRLGPAVLAQAREFSAASLPYPNEATRRIAAEIVEEVSALEVEAPLREKVRAFLAAMAGASGFDVPAGEGRELLQRAWAWKVFAHARYPDAFKAQFDERGSMIVGLGRHVIVGALSHVRVTVLSGEGKPTGVASGAGTHPYLVEVSGTKIGGLVVENVAGGEYRLFAVGVVEGQVIDAGPERFVSEAGSVDEYAVAPKEPAGPAGVAVHAFVPREVAAEETAAPPPPKEAGLPLAVPTEVFTPPGIPRLPREASLLLVAGVAALVLAVALAVYVHRQNKRLERLLQKRSP